MPRYREIVKEMELIGVRVEFPENAPIILLREKADARRILPIYIANPEATAIAYATDGIRPPRPLTHDLMADLLEGLDATLDRIVITDLRDGTFYAELILTGIGEPRHVSARPSDAVALAARTNSPIFAEEAVLDAAAVEAVEPAEASDENPEELVDEFREFIEHINPEDFAS